ncbi:hypothetical protein CLAFUW4_09973 [Fulvia fulva]|uniref:Aminoglycoside phosphotransferase domain-containing protein n=1 Tax=Passalora fulva TaxID=5499 RepID=A0A9Q8PI43_PASFU|nr:uncharacterized protein CLAFUR5_12270 [Fulvia fulva]KAK4615564.1 hypothetical protein CLAFUR4_09977 [Fulvia fulva]KAK4616713.1 hypothetical protein CLAFUR0_09974 [Fulvia fulva]UJO22888.1 hypothetical protein CLAFUR5_12270 [Fulvia fulva]WPV19620.1 hypothetical protein CLAFUW4_09973 [Fulvia fulva]WPV34680.1 hypothetical protein CLAFUW7_09974 [Fulvia fulva]
MSSGSTGQSSSSSTPNSTSTYEYSHEPYDTFKAKVLSLTQSLSSTQEIDLQRARGGSYNRVVIARLTLASSCLAGIFRIPRFPDIPDAGEEGRTGAIDVNILDQAAILQFLAKKLIPAPRLIAFDASPNSAIESPYIFQEFSGGSALDLVYGSMSHGEKIEIVDALTDFLVRMEHVQFPACGLLVAESRSSSTMTKASRLDDTLQDLTSAVKGFTISTEDDSTYSSCSTKALIGQLLAARKEEDETESRKPNKVSSMWSGLCDMFDHMCSLGFFSSLNQFSVDGSILYHWDLEPRNILVKQASTKDHNASIQHAEERHEELATMSWTIDRVIDWDRVQAVPPLLARKPPVWLWDFSEDDEHSSLPSIYDGDVDLLSASRYDRDEGRLDTQSQLLRTHFEEGFIRQMQKLYPEYNAEIYREETYGRGRWLRRLARFAIHGASDNQDVKRYTALEREWCTVRSQYE